MGLLTIIIILIRRYSQKLRTLREAYGVVSILQFRIIANDITSHLNLFVNVHEVSMLEVLQSDVLKFRIGGKLISACVYM